MLLLRLSESMTSTLRFGYADELVLTVALLLPSLVIPEVDTLSLDERCALGFVSATG